MKSFYRPRSNPDGWSVNARCLDEETRPVLQLSEFDGRHWEEHAAELAIVRMDQLDLPRPLRESLARDGQRVRIPVDPDEPRRARLEQRRRVTAEAQRAIDEHPAAPGRESLHHLGPHHRNMLGHERGRPNPAVTA